MTDRKKEKIEKSKKRKISRKQRDKDLEKRVGRRFGLAIRDSKIKRGSLAYGKIWLELCRHYGIIKKDDIEFEIKKIDRWKNKLIGPPTDLVGAFLDVLVAFFEVPERYWTSERYGDDEFSEIVRKQWKSIRWKIDEKKLSNEDVKKHILSLYKGEKDGDICHTANENDYRRAVLEYERQKCQDIDVLGFPMLPIESSFIEPRLVQDVKEDQAGNGFRSADHCSKRGRKKDLSRPNLKESSPVGVRKLLLRWKDYVDDSQPIIPRFVILGDPGGGKSTLIRYVSWCIAREEDGLFEETEDLVPAYVRLPLWEKDARNDSRYLALPEYLADRKYSQSVLDVKSSAAVWSEWIESGKAVLLLDGLDEVQKDFEEFWRDLRVLLISKVKCPVIITCRTQEFAHCERLGVQLPTFKLQPLEPEQIKHLIGRYTDANPDRYKSDQVTDRVEKDVYLKLLARNPLILSIVCFIADDQHRGELPRTKAGLYQRAVNELLERPREEDPAEVRSLSTTSKRNILSRMAFKLLVNRDHGPVFQFSEVEMMKSIAQAVEEEGFGNVGSLSEAIRRFLLNKGLIQKQGREFEMLHPTFHEFLAAQYIADRIDYGRNAYQTEIQVGKWDVTVAEFIDKKAWDSEWHEVIRFLAGACRNSRSLLSILMDASIDDLFRHRLCLAATCLPEIETQIRDGARNSNLDCTEDVDELLKVSERVQEDLISFWWMLADAGVSFDHINVCMPAVGEVLTHKLQKMIVDRVRFGQGDGRLQALRLLEMMGNTAPRRQDVVTVLLDVLDDEAPILVGAAIKILGNIAEFGENTDSVIKGLLKTLWDERSDSVRTASAWALQRIEGAAGQFEVVNDLYLTALQCGMNDVGKRALLALEKVPDEDKRGIIQAIIESALPAGDVRIRRNGAAILGWAFERWGVDADRLRKIIDLSLCKEHQGWNSDASEENKKLEDFGLRQASSLEIVQGVVAKALSMVQDSEMKKEIVSDLVFNLKKNAEPEMQVGIIRILEEVGSDPSVLKEFLKILKNRRGAPECRAVAANALGKIGGVVEIEEDIVKALGEAVGTDEESHVRSCALASLQTLIEAGLKSQEQEAIGYVGDVLYDSSGNMRANAACRIWEMADKSAIRSEGVLRGLLENLNHDDKNVRFWALATLIRFVGLGNVRGEAVRELAHVLHAEIPVDSQHSGTPNERPNEDNEGHLGMLRVLSGALEHEHKFIRDAAADALGGLGEAAGMPFVVDALVRGAFQRDLENYGRQDGQRCAYALGKMRDSAIKHGVVEKFCDRISNYSSDDRETVASVLLWTRDSFATNEMIQAAADYVITSGRDYLARSTTVRWLGDYSGSPPQAEIIQRLMAVLRDEDQFVYDANYAISKVMDAGVRMFTRNCPFPIETFVNQPDSDFGVWRIVPMFPSRNEQNIELKMVQDLSKI